MKFSFYLESKDNAKEEVSFSLLIFVDIKSL